MVLRNVLLGPHSTFRIGGPASYFAGVGPSVDRDANVFVDDGGFDGLVVRTADSADVEVLEDGRLRVKGANTRVALLLGDGWEDRRHGLLLSLEGRHFSCRASSGGSVVLVDEPAEPVVAVDPGRA
jgi:hypothetical protein